MHYLSTLQYSHSVYVYVHTLRTSMSVRRRALRVGGGGRRRAATSTQSAAKRTVRQQLYNVRAVFPGTDRGCVQFMQRFPYIDHNIMSGLSSALLVAICWQYLHIHIPRTIRSDIRASQAGMAGDLSTNVPKSIGYI